MSKIGSRVRHSKIAATVWGAAILALVCGGMAPAEVVSLQEGVNGYQGTQDVGLVGGQGGSPDVNYGDDQFLALYEREEHLQNMRRALLRFDLNSIKPGAAISAVTLTIYTRPYAYDAKGVTNSLYLVAAANKGWKENGATWNHRGASAAWMGRPGLNAGEDYQPIAVATAATPNTNEADQKSGDVPMSFVLNPFGVAAVQYWIDHPSQNAGFVLRQPDGSFSVDTFWSSEAENTAVRPKLTLTITPGRASNKRWLLGSAFRPTHYDFGSVMPFAASFPLEVRR